MLMAVQIVSRETKKIRRRNTEHGQLTLINLWILHSFSNKSDLRTKDKALDIPPFFFNSDMSLLNGKLCLLSKFF